MAQNTVINDHTIILFNKKSVFLLIYDSIVNLVKNIYTLYYLLNGCFCTRSVKKITTLSII